MLFKDETGRPLGIVAVNHNITERKKTEIALRESEARYRLLAENSNDVVMRLTPAFNYLYVSSSSRSVLGYEPEELVGPSDFRRIHPDDAPAIRDLIKRLVEEPGGGAITYRFLHKEGRYIWLESTGRAVVSKQTGEVVEFVFSARDISDRKRAEEALRESEERFRQIAENIDQILFVRSGDDQKILYINPVYETLWGKSRESLYENPSSFTESVHPDDLKYVYQQLSSKRYLEEGLADFEYRIIPLDQQIHWVHAHTFPIKYEEVILRRAGIIEDITERKLADQALRESEERFRFLVEGIKEYAIYLLDALGNIVSWNAGAERLKGYKSDEILGQNFSRFFTPEAQQNHRPQELLAEAELLGRTEDEGWRVRKDGSRFWANVAITALRKADGSLSGFAKISRDMTLRKQAEEDLRNALAKEKELGELKTRFVSMASHEFRTPLATILAMTETLSAYRHKLSEEQIETRLSKIREQIDYLKDIMDDVLLLARMQARRVEFNPVRLNLDDLCRSVIDEFQSRADMKHMMLYSCDERLREVILDRKLMRQIVNNLVSNAIKYSPPDKTIWINLIYSDDTFVLKIRDEGIGIPEVDMKHLFEPFHRAENVGTTSGTGLGLVITKESVELHGGTISVESQIGVGTAFTVSIPLRNKGETKHDENIGY